MSKERGLSGKSHFSHLTLTVLTCGLWGIFVWFPLWIFRLFVRRKKRTTYYAG